MEKVNFYCGKINSQGGSKISLLNTLYLLNNENKPFSIYVSDKGWFTKQLEKKNISYFVIKEPRLIKKINRGTNIFTVIIYFLLSLRILIKNGKYINKLIKDGEKVVFNEPRDLILFYPFLFRKRIIKILWFRSEQPSKISLQLMKRVDKIITVTDIIKNNIKDKVNRSKIYTIHNFMFEHEKKLVNKSINDKVINLAVVGSIQRIKGQLDAVKVLSHLDKTKYKLYIVGRPFDKSYTKIIQEYVEDLGLSKNVQFLNHIDNIPHFLNHKIHITLIPSQTESFCRVAMESLSVGVPVIAYGVGGLTEVVKEKNTGILVEKDNILNMVDAVNMLTFNTSYQSMRENAYTDWNRRFFYKGIKEKLFRILYTEGDS